jgi:hypothetical protein
MRYFSTKAGALCTRYGTGTYIGASISVVKGQTQIAYDEQEVVAISDQELALYGREYSGLLEEGSLVERKKADFEDWQEAVAKASEKDALTEPATEKPTPEAEPEAEPEVVADPKTES